MKLSREFVRGGETVAVPVESLEGDRYRVRVGENTYEYDARALADGGVRVQRIGDDTKGSVAYGAGSAQSYMLRVDGKTHELAAPQSRRGGGRGGGADGTGRAPMTGTVLDAADGHALGSRQLDPPCRAADVQQLIVPNDGCFVGQLEHVDSVATQRDHQAQRIGTGDPDSATGQRQAGANRSVEQRRQPAITA